MKIFAAQIVYAQLLVYMPCVCVFVCVYVYTHVLRCEWVCSNVCTYSCAMLAAFCYAFVILLPSGSNGTQTITSQIGFSLIVWDSLISFLLFAFIYTWRSSKKKCTIIYMYIIRRIDVKASFPNKCIHINARWNNKCNSSFFLKPDFEIKRKSWFRKASIIIKVSLNLIKKKFLKILD